jgi:hypothetical protein
LEVPVEGSHIAVASVLREQLGAERGAAMNPGAVVAYTLGELSSAGSIEALGCTDAG